ncbi:MAG: two-component sensor histidine kinase [Firmicutes bacterium]|nr:two-component sensor histidine kinase [Bacillota bacterium]
MEKKLKFNFILIGIISVALSFILSMMVFHNAINEQEKTDVRNNAKLIAAVYKSGENFEKILGRSAENTGIRITLISSAGEVWLENTAEEEMENHLDRPEVIKAMESGTGEQTRFSETLRKDCYYYAIKLSDGNILRVSLGLSDLNSAYIHAAPAIVLSGIIVVVIAVILSVWLTKRFVRPIIKFADDPDNMGEKVPFKELEPFAEEMIKRQQRANETERMRREFTANVSHELKTPLTSISGYAEMIESGMAKKEDVKGFAGKIHNEAGRLITLIGDIIKLSELDALTGNESFEKIELLSLAKETRGIFEYNTEREGISFEVFGERAWVMGDRSILGQLIYNLCDNAVRYNRRGGSIKVEVKKENSECCLIVSDTGIGIEKEHLERVFERFYRADKSRSKERGGTGLGLAIVKHAAILHKAAIKIDSEPGVGTRIEVRFKAV